MPLSGVRLFQRITSLPGPLRSPANLDCRRPGPDDFRLMAPPAGASIPESKTSLPHPPRPSQSQTPFSSCWCTERLMQEYGKLPALALRAYIGICVFALRATTKPAPAARLRRRSDKPAQRLEGLILQLHCVMRQSPASDLRRAPSCRSDLQSAAVACHESRLRGSRNHTNTKGLS